MAASLEMVHAEMLRRRSQHRSGMLDGSAIKGNGSARSGGPLVSRPSQDGNGNRIAGHALVCRYRRRLHFRLMRLDFSGHVSGEFRIPVAQ